ncbi:MAG: 30S ribosomal protein S7 [Peptococcaceae bacterium]|nr:30S ribosomal protein S7 [Peptococcaceae bacterium]
MPRRGNVSKREVLPDPVYNSTVITKLINQIMLDGEKSIAERIVYDALDTVREKSGKDPLEVFDAAMKNIMPVLEVKARRVGGANYQVPVEVRADRRQTLGIRWLVTFTRKRSGKSMQEKLAAELMDAANNVGASVKKREDTHKMAESNRAFAHYRW